MGSTISEETERIERQILAPHATLASESKRLLGVVAVISDFWENADDIVKTVAPLKFRGNEVILFHVLDPQELKPKLKGPALFESPTTTVLLREDERAEVTPRGWLDIALG